MQATRWMAAGAAMIAAMAVLSGWAVADPVVPPPGASACSGCHPASAGVITPVPRLAGRKAAEIVALMQAFKTGKRPSTVMARIARGLTEAEIAAIAAWYAQQK